MKTKKPSKQRKRLYQSPHHRRRKHLSASLSTELKSRYGTNAIPVRTGDNVRILRGDRRGLEGKISKVDMKSFRIFVEGITREKSDGTTVPFPIHPSKVEITKLNLDDKWRKGILRKKGAVEEVKAPEEGAIEVKEVEAPEEAPKEAAVEAGGT